LENFNEMDNILGLSMLNQDQFNQLNKPITPKEIEAVIKHLPTFPCSIPPPPPLDNTRARWFWCKILPDFQIRANSNTPQNIPQNTNRKNTEKPIL
jgi:hypothetical protein